MSCVYVYMYMIRYMNENSSTFHNGSRAVVPLQCLLTRDIHACLPRAHVSEMHTLRALLDRRASKCEHCDPCHAFTKRTYTYIIYG